MSAARSSPASTPMTTRSGFMKSSIAAPCFRNSGLLTTLNGLRRLAGDRVAHLFRAVPTGTVLLSTTTVYLFIARPMSRATVEHVLQVGRAVLTLRRADGDEDDLRCANRRRQIGREAQTLLVRDCGAPAPRGQARRSASAPASSVAIFAASLSTHTTVVAVLGQAGAQDQTDVSCSDDGDFHFTIRY